MNKLATVKSLSLAAVAALSMSVGLTAQAQTLEPVSPPLGVYVGGTAGIGLTNFLCDGSCSPHAFAGKIFGGKRLTPGLAAEVNYLMFGQMERGNDAATSKARGFSAEKRRVNALTLGINWEVELIQDFTNQIRVGWAFMDQKNKVTGLDGVERRADRRLNAPYVGAGIGFRLNRTVKLLSAVDFVVDGHDSLYLFGVGAMVEF